jgi:hypothetical protein
MKYFFRIMLAAAGIFFCSHIYAQVNKDSLLERSLRDMQKQLQLNGDQTEAIHTLMKKQRNTRDELYLNKSLKIEDRGKELEKMQTQYEKDLKKILSNNQWKQYKEIEAANREIFLKRMKEKKIPYKELERTNN